MGTADTRIALKKGTELRFNNHDNSMVTYTIQDEIGRGGSVIVYNASYLDNAGCRNLVRIRECCPFYVPLIRGGDGALTAEEAYIADFQEYVEKMRTAYKVSKELFYTDGLTNLISNTLNLYEANGTVYTVSTWLQGEVLTDKTAKSVKQCISIAKSVSSAIRRLHDNGYLYLDVKPDNVFILEGVTEIVQLFDFDTLVPLSEIGERGGAGKYRIACTSGYAAYEQQAGRFSRLGRHTDVYGVGALLFYLLFGRVPGASDCETDAEYCFSSSRFAGQHYQDRLFQALPDFFHHTLANCRIDRYPDMEEVVNQLEEIEKYADTVMPFLISSQVSCPRVLVGREAELAALHTWMSQGETNCLFLTGMGGIGKSTLVRQFIADNRRSFDAVLYLYYNGSVRKMITDDTQLQINSVERRPEENEADYFYRKMKMLRNLVSREQASEKEILLVMDNYEGEPDRDFAVLLDMGWKIIAVTRNEMPETGYRTLRLGPIARRENLRTLFESYIRRELEEEEQGCLEKIIDSVSGHTLALQLIARQVECSHISVPEAAALLEERGFGNIAPEKVDYVKDQMLFYEKVSDIIGMLFEAGHMEDGERMILKVMSLFPVSGVDINDFANMLKLDSKNAVNGLIRQGWMQSAGKILSIHPVVNEVIRQWEWTDSGRQMFAALANGIMGQLDAEGRKAGWEKSGWKAGLEKIDMEKIDREKTDREKTGWERGKQWQVGGVHRNRLLWLNVAECVLDNGGKDETLKNKAEYYDLLYSAVMCMPFDREEYILEHAAEWLNAAAEGKGVSFFTTPEKTSEEEEALIDLYDRVIMVYGEQKNLEMASAELKKAENRARKYGSHYILGRYYTILADYYDYVIAGDYYRKRHTGEVYRRLFAVDRAIHHLKKGKTADARFYCIRALLTKAHILILAYPERYKEILKLLDAAKPYTVAGTAMGESLGGSREIALTRQDYDLVKGWYHTYMDRDYESMMRVMEDAAEIGRYLSRTGLSIITSILRPWAIMLFDLEKYDEAAEKLKEGIRICEKDEYRSVIPYIRKKVDLYACLLDAYYLMKDFGKCREVIGVIDEENLRNREIGVVKVIAEDYRGEVFGKEQGGGDGQQKQAEAGKMTADVEENRKIERYRRE